MPGAAAWNCCAVSSCDLAFPSVRINRYHIIYNPKNTSLAFLAELLAQLPVLALLHLQHFFELLREDEVVHPAVDDVFAEVAVGWEGVLLVEGHVVELLVGLEELLVVETD